MRIVKQELFLADVTTCFTTLKKAVQEMRMPEAVDLQMAQNSARHVFVRIHPQNVTDTSFRLDAVTVRADPSAAFAIQFEHLFPVSLSSDVCICKLIRNLRRIGTERIQSTTVCEIGRAHV